jgi:hypothetical protein
VLGGKIIGAERNLPGGFANIAFGSGFWACPGWSRVKPEAKSSQRRKDSTVDAEDGGELAVGRGGCRRGATPGGQSLEHRPLGPGQLATLLDTAEQVGEIAGKQLFGDVG